ncbi:MAG: hypothetical protein HQ580_08590 [Planctomycetes bacterium]|nr:hypothetical protein [Planctomycetota bacterium]
MNHAKNLRLRNIIIAVAAVLVITSAGASAQQKLGDLVTEGGFDWMIGRWEATGDQGEKIELVYKWELDKHLLTMQLKLPDNEYRAMIFYKPTEDKIIQITIDNKGGIGKGTWDADGNKAVLKHEHTGTDWQTYKMGFAHSKVDANTMKWEIHEMYGSDELSNYPDFTIEFKRQKKQAPKK